MKVKYILFMCLIYSTARVNSLLDDNEVRDLFNTISKGYEYIYESHFVDYYNGANREEFRELLKKNGRDKTRCFAWCGSGMHRMDFEEFKEVAKKGGIPTWQIAEINNLWKALKSEGRECITINDLGRYYGNENAVVIWSEIQNERNVVANGQEINGTIDLEQFTKAVNLCLIPRYRRLHDEFREIIGNNYNVRQYIIGPDMDSYYRPGQVGTVHGNPVLNYYGQIIEGERRLYFGGFSKAVNFGKLPKPRIENEDEN